MNLSSYTFTVVHALSTLTVIGQGIAVIVLIAMLNRKGRFAQWISRNALILMFIVALTATCGSLFFSEIAGWTPCKDCWLQRICMYPQVVLLAVALWKRDRGIGSYILPLCVIGMILAGDHYMDQVGAALAPAQDAVLKPCDSTGVSCAATQIKFTYGYITIPMMAFTAFALNAIGSIYLMRSRK